ncbi:hypothetical protein [Ornithinimicrobium panacihumi]|uniref:hypothetical protein n=1 Tax=Ornithinimicrobium panacihumi TaxID=2008449 RepID=UPI003F8AD550
MSPRLTSALTHVGVFAVAWILYRRVLDLTPLGRHEPWSEVLLAALGLGVILGLVDYFVLWPRRQRNDRS